MARRDDRRRGFPVVSRAFSIAVLLGGVALVSVATAAIATQHRAHRTTETVLSSYAGNWGDQLVVDMNRQRLSLYVFARHHGNSACYGRCQKVWYPLIDHGKIVAGRRSQIDTNELGTTKRRNGSLQVTYYGQPLYRCRRDTKTAQIYGAYSWQFHGAWALMHTNGSPLPVHYGPSKPIPAC